MGSRGPGSVGSGSAGVKNDDMRLRDMTDGNANRIDGGWLQKLGSITSSMTAAPRSWV